MSGQKRKIRKCSRTEKCAGKEVLAVGRLWKSFNLKSALERMEVVSEEQWEVIVQDHGGNFERLGRMMSHTDMHGKIAFGEGFGFNKFPTLAQWAGENNPGMFPILTREDAEL